MTGVQTCALPISAGQTCALLLATVGGRTSDAAAVRGDAGSDRATAATDRIDGGQVLSEVCLSRVEGRSVAKVGSPWRQFRLWWFGISCRRDEPDESVSH